MDHSEMIAGIKQDTEQAKARLLKTFEFVPEDKLTWAPSDTCRNPLWIVAHCGVSNDAFAAILRGEQLPVPSDKAEQAKRIWEGGKDVRTREAAIALVEQNTARVLQALDRVTPEMAASNPPSPFGPVPFTFWMQLPADHMDGHASQIDYIQTIWGDLQNHL